MGGAERRGRRKSVSDEPKSESKVNRMAMVGPLESHPYTCGETDP
jgi:hypothetical protein